MCRLQILRKELQWRWEHGCQTGMTDTKCAIQFYCIWAKAIHFDRKHNQTSDIELTEMIFSTWDFCNVCGIDDDNGGNYRHVKKVPQSLDKETNAAGCFAPTALKPNFLINKVYFDRLEGSIRLRIDEDMKPFLMLAERKFTQFDLLYTLGANEVSLFDPRMNSLRVMNGSTNTSLVLMNWKRKLWSWKLWAVGRFLNGMYARHSNERNWWVFRICKLHIT